MITIGTKIKLLRALFDMKQFELAQRIKISQGHLSMIESGIIHPLDDEVIGSIQEAFGGVSLDDPRIDQFATLKNESQPLAA